MDRVDTVIKALKVGKEDAIKIVEHLDVCDWTKKEKTSR